MQVSLSDGKVFHVNHATFCIVSFFKMGAIVQVCFTVSSAKQTQIKNFIQSSDTK